MNRNALFYIFLKLSIEYEVGKNMVYSRKVCCYVRNKFFSYNSTGHKLLYRVK